MKPKSRFSDIYSKLYINTFTESAVQ